MQAKFFISLLTALLLTPVAVATGPEQIQILLSGTVEDIRAVSFDIPCDQNSDVKRTELFTQKSHGIRLLDAQTDRLIWQLDSMAFAVCADITAVDTNEDGYIDRLYFANTGGQLWRVDLGAEYRDLWRAQLLLELEGGQSFYTAPDVVVSQDGAYYAVIIGTGDKPLPNQQAVQNYVIFYRDHCIQTGTGGCAAITKTLADLQQLASPNRAQQPLDREKYNNGWYLPLARGEATVTRAITNNYTTLVATFSSDINSPCAVSDCNKAGQSRLYYFNPFHFDSHSELDNKPYYQLVEGAEPLPEPVPFILLPDPPTCDGQGCNPHASIISGFSFGDSKQQIDQPELGLIKKTWWYNRRDN